MLLVLYSHMYIDMSMNCANNKLANYIIIFLVTVCVMCVMCDVCVCVCVCVHVCVCVCV